MKEMMRRGKGNKSGFTLLEVMIAIAVFGLLLVYASQFMRTEIRSYDSASEQNEIRQKARVALMQIVDEIRLTLTYYEVDDTSGAHCIYRYKDEIAAAEKDRTGAECLIYISTDDDDSSSPLSAEIYFNKSQGELWYRKDGNRYLIADQIAYLSMTEDASLVKIHIGVGREDGSEPYELLTWVRVD